MRRSCQNFIKIQLVLLIKRHLTPFIRYVNVVHPYLQRSSMSVMRMRAVAVQITPAMMPALYSREYGTFEKAYINR